MNIHVSTSWIFSRYQPSWFSSFVFLAAKAAQDMTLSLSEWVCIPLFEIMHSQKGCFKNVSVALQGCFEGGSRMLKASEMFQEGGKETSRMLQRSFKNA